MSLQQIQGSGSPAIPCCCFRWASVWRTAVWLVEADTAGLLPRRASAAGTPHMRPTCGHTPCPPQRVVCQLWKPSFEASAKFPESPIWPRSPPQPAPHCHQLRRHPQISSPFSNSLPFPDPKHPLHPVLLDIGCDTNPSTQGAETGGWQVPSPPGPRSKEPARWLVLF